jgi:hypothetical protein
MEISETVQHQVYVTGAEDAHGNEIESWAAAVSLGIYAFGPGESVEPLTPGYDRVVTTPTLFVPSTAVLTHRDRVTVRGLLFEVDGDMLPFRNPFDPSMDGNSVNLKRVTG